MIGIQKVSGYVQSKDENQGEAYSLARCIYVEDKPQQKVFKTHSLQPLKGVGGRKKNQPVIKTIYLLLNLQLLQYFFTIIPHA